MRFHIKTRYIPLETGIGIKEIDENKPIEDIINRTEIIDFLKEDIISSYRPK